MDIPARRWPSAPQARCSEARHDAAPVCRRWQARAVPDDPRAGGPAFAAKRNQNQELGAGGPAFSAQRHQNQELGEGGDVFADEARAVLLPVMMSPERCIAQLSRLPSKDEDLEDMPRVCKYCKRGESYNLDFADDRVCRPCFTCEEESSGFL